VDCFINKGYEVVVVDNLSTGKRENINSKAKFYNVDIQNPLLEDVFDKERPDFVFMESQTIYPAMRLTP